MNKSTYETPLNSRYASPEMQYIFSPDKKFTTWRKLWVALAESEMELGLPVTQAQVDELKAHIEDIDYENARRHEQRVRHDVMAHVHAYGDVCPGARGIIHLGATSCYVTDNADILMLRDALELIRQKLVEVLRRLRKFAWEYRDLPCLGYTHLQPAQLTTVGKRASLWMQDLVMDLDEVNFALSSLKLLGNRGATGTQVSFMELFDGDGEKVDELERRIARKMGMTAVFDVSGQTYPRKLDSRVLGCLSGIAQSAYKFAQDLRLLQSFREVEEPFEKNQIGSSAMAYKRNPMRSERICALSRHVMAVYQDAAMTAATQWFERTLDDSANRRLSLPESALHGHRGHHHGVRQGRRGPSGHPRARPRPLPGRGHPHEGRGPGERPAGAHRRRPGFPHRPREPHRPAGPGQVHRPRPGADRALHRAHRGPHPRSLQGRGHGDDHTVMIWNWELGIGNYQRSLPRDLLNVCAVICGSRTV